MAMHHIRGNLKQGVVPSSSRGKGGEKEVAVTGEERGERIKERRVEKRDDLEPILPHYIRQAS